MKERKTTVWFITYKETGNINDDSCGDLKPFYTCFKSKKDAKEYVHQTFKEHKSMVSVTCRQIVTYQSK